MDIWIFPLKVVMAWNLANYLPEEGNIRGNFNRVVMGYLSSIYDYLQSEKERIAPGTIWWFIVRGDVIDVVV